MIIERLKRLFLVLPDEHSVDRLSSSETDALFSAMGCDHMPVYMPAEVWQRVSDMEYDQHRV